MKDWTLGIMMGAVGIPIVAFAATGWAPTFVDAIFWTLAGIGWVVLAMRYATRAWVATLSAGLASGLWAGAMQALLLPVLVANNAAWSAYSVDGATRFEAFYSALPIGIVWGLLFAGIAVLTKKISARRRPAMAA